MKPYDVPDEKHRPYRRYIGDGVYADYDGYALQLTTENGVTVTNRIVIETEVWKALRDYMAWLKKQHEEGR